MTFNYSGPALIEVRISPTEPVNPMIPSGKANHEMEGLEMKRILHLKVTDQVSTLNRITSAFVRLQYNINELTVKPSQEKGISDMQITADIEDEAIFKILIAKLKNKSVYSKFKILVRTEIRRILMR